MFYYIFSNSSEFTGPQIIAIIMAYVLAVIIAITFHEFAHALVAYKSGDNSLLVKSRLSLNPAKHLSGLGLLAFLVIGFGWANPVIINPLKFKNYKRSMAFVSVAGVTANIILAFIFSGLYFVFDTFVFTYTNMLEIFFAYFFDFAVIINLALAVFNLLPIYPLDGFNFIKTFLKTNNKFVEFMYKYGTLVLFIVILTPIFDGFYSLVVGGLSGIFSAFWGLFI